MLVQGLGLGVTGPGKRHVADCFSQFKHVMDLLTSRCLSFCCESVLFPPGTGASIMTTQEQITS